MLEVVRTGLDALSGRPRESPEAALLRTRDRRYRRWRRHIQAWLAVCDGLGALNLLVAVTTGITFPWALIPMIGWGVGLSLHGMVYRSWSKDNAQQIAAAERSLGLAAPEQKALPAPGKDPLEQLVQRAHIVVGRAQDALTEADIEGRASSELDSAAVCAELDLGLENLEKLVQSGLRVRRVIFEHGESDELEDKIAQIDARMVGASPDIEIALQENRALLLERRARIQGLTHEVERLEARAEGFILAAENLCLEASRIDAGTGGVEAVAEPLERLKEELSVMRKVEAELAGLQ